MTQYVPGDLDSVQARLEKLEVINAYLNEANGMLAEEREAWKQRAQQNLDVLRRTVEGGEFLRAALLRIKDTCGRVCDDFELCRHRACQSSYEAWSIADCALRGETPESDNDNALARFREETR